MAEEIRTGGRVVVLGLSVEFRGATRDLVAELPFGATVGSLANAIAGEIDYATPHVVLEVVRTGELLPTDAVAADSDLRSGDLVRLRSPSPARARGTASEPVAVLLKGRRAEVEPVVTIRPPKANRDSGGVLELRWAAGSTLLAAGDYSIGSDPRSDVHLVIEGLPATAFELSVSRASARVRRAAGGATVSLDGAIVERDWQEVLSGSQLRAGSARLAVHLNDGATTDDVRRPVVSSRPRERTKIELGGAGEVQFNRPPRRSSLWRPAQIELPTPPPPVRRARLPFVAALVPLVAGLAMFLLLKDALMLAFMGLSPLMAVGTYVADRRSGRKDHVEAAARFDGQLAAAGSALYEAVKTEVVERHIQAPQLAAIARWAEDQDDRLWERRPSDGDYLAVPLGWGRLPAMTRVLLPTVSTSEPDPRVAELIAQYRDVEDVPYVISFESIGTVGFSGDRPTSVDAARALALQAVILHSPAHLGIAAALPRGADGGWEWLKWLPHARTAAAMLDGFSLGTGNRGLDMLQRVRALEQRRLDQNESRGGRSRVALLVVVDEELQVDRSLVADMLSAARGAGTSFIWIGGDPRALPGQCGITVDTAPDRTARVIEIDTGLERTPVRLDVADAAIGAMVARAMAPIRDSSSADASASIPRRVRLLQQLGLDAPTGQQVAELWQQPDTGLGAVIGACAAEPMRIDLRADGPHALIAGTTGAGKSELLRTLVVSLAARHPPSRLTFLLVDYKGGAAFAPCRMLPHVLDVVSDLDAELGARALASLDAEMKRRERLLAEVKADNLIDLERRAPDVAPPNLVIMVDEFAKLREEIPEFIDGVVDVAQRGRTLGIHMVLAAQSLRTAFTPAVRANTNLRIALRVTSENESQDVLDAPDAARIPSGEGARGRAFARIGHERLAEFQTSHVSGRFVDPTAAEAIVRSFGFDAVLAPSVRRDARDGAPPGADETDLAALARAAREAARRLRIPAPRAAWTPPLPRAYPRSQVQRYTDALAGRCAIGLVDEPEHQRQTPLVLDLASGHVAVFGFSGAGKTTALQTIAAALAWDAPGDRLEIYGIDAASGALGMIEPLPNVGAVVPISDAERVERLLFRLERSARTRSRHFAAAGVSTLNEYQRKLPEDAPPRVVVLIDGFSEFATTYDNGRPNSVFERFQALLAIGRTSGIHVILTADRRSAVRSNVTAHVSQRIVLQCASTDDLIAFGVPPRLADKVELGPGRCFTADAHIAQIALPAPAPWDDLAGGFQALGRHLEEVCPGRSATPVDVLPESFSADGLPTAVSSKHVPIALGGSDLEAQAFDLSERHVVVSGPYRSGRSNVLCVLAEQAARIATIGEIHVLAPRRSQLLQLDIWRSVSRGADECAAAAQELASRLDGLPDDRGANILLVIDDGGEIQDAATWSALERIARAGRDRGVRIVAAAETSAARMLTNPWFRELRKDGQGLLLMPETPNDGDILGVALPRRESVAMVPGRGYLVTRGVPTLVQVPFAGAPNTVANQARS